MHIYIYDSFVSEKRNNSTLAKIETRITDLGLSGKIIRLNIINSIHNAIENEIKKGAKTIIAVGGNKILNQTINAVAKLSHLSLNNKIPVGFIPVGKKNNSITDILGIDNEEIACDILSARIIKKINLGRINDLFFLSNISIDSKNTTIEIDQNYIIEISKNKLINIINFYNKEISPQDAKIKSQNKLKLLIKTKKTNTFMPAKNNISQQSIFPFNNLQIINKENIVTIDDAFSIKTPANIRIAKEKIDLIVGKKRKF